MICAGLDVKTWSDHPNGCPAPALVRPGACESCLAQAGQPGALLIHGHGTVLRGLRVAVGGGIEDLDLVLRRFRCLDCGHVMTAAPREVRAWFRYSLALIASALAAWSLGDASETQLRTTYSDDDGRYSETYGRWPNLRRWVAKTRRLFGPRAPQPTTGSAKACARSVVNWLDGYSPPGSEAPLAERVALAVRSAAF